MQNKGNISEFIQKLKDKCDIISVISKYLTVTKKGKTYWACCPFHFEKTPSFAINEVEQYYHCFGCGESGDVIKFVEKYESVDFMTAVSTLAKSVGMEMPEFEANDDILRQSKLKDKMYNACNLAMEHYQNNLRIPNAKTAIDYMKGRQIDGATAVKFKIGFANGWTNLVDFLKSKNVSLDVAKQAGLVECKDGRYYDVMANRLMFPIINSYGDCIGFTARTLEKDSKFAKYRNSTQTLVFDKSKVVYNINNIKELKKESNIDYIIIVEGTMDVIALVKAGFENTVACMGTAITPFHAKELKRFTNKIVLCLDGDSAGQNAMFKAIDVLLDSGLDVRVVSLKENLDPDEYLKKYGKDSLRDEIENHALVALDYKLIRLSKRFNLNNNYEKAKYIKESYEIIANLSVDAEKELYLKLISKLTNVSVDVLRRDMNKNSQKQPTADIVQEVIKSEEVREEGIQKAIKYILASIVHKKEYADKIDDTIELYFKNPNHQKLFNYIMECRQQDKIYTISSLFDMFDVDNNKDIKDIIDFNFSKYDGNEKIYFSDSLRNVYKIGIEMKEQTLKEEYKKETDLTKKREIAMKLSEIAKMKNKRLENE